MAATCSLTAWNVFPVPIKPMPSWSQSRKFASSKKPGIHWVIVGGESGPGARKMEKSWLESVRLQCSAAGIPFFFKQWGGVQKSRNGRVLNGLTYNEIPRFPAETVRNLCG